MSSILSFSLRQCNSSLYCYHRIKNPLSYDLHSSLLPTLGTHITALPQLRGPLQSQLLTQCQNRKMLCLQTLNIFRTSAQINSLFQGLRTNWVFPDCNWIWSHWIMRYVLICFCCICVCACMRVWMCFVTTKILWVLIFKPVLKRACHPGLTQYCIAC